VCQTQPHQNSTNLVRVELERLEINFESSSEEIGSSSPADRLVFHAFAALAHFARNLIRKGLSGGDAHGL
jgi:DNA invertase Pin-like site-specific DNA recombinase